jgi:hypothetical protein
MKLRGPNSNFKSIWKLCSEVVRRPFNESLLRFEAENVIWRRCLISFPKCRLNGCVGAVKRTAANTVKSHKKVHYSAKKLQVAARKQRVGFSDRSWRKGGLCIVLHCGCSSVAVLAQLAACVNLSRKHARASYHGCKITAEASVWRGHNVCSDHLALVLVSCMPLQVCKWCCSSTFLLWCYSLASMWLHVVSETGRMEVPVAQAATEQSLMRELTDQKHSGAEACMA